MGNFHTPQVPNQRSTAEGLYNTSLHNAILLIMYKLSDVTMHFAVKKHLQSALKKY